MYINEQHKLIVLGVPKNASSSMNYALNEQLGMPAELIFNATQISDGHPTLVEFLTEYPMDTTDYTVIAAIRNSYERVVSGCARVFPIEFAERPQEIMLDQLSQGQHVFLRTQTEYTADATHIIGLDNLEAQLNVILAELGIPHVTLPFFNVSAHNHYSTYYNDTLKHKVESMYAADIAEFGFSFDAPQ